VVKEFKSTDYKLDNKRVYIICIFLLFSRMKITVLGSRDQLCVHPDVKSLENSSDKIAACREKVHRRTCVFHRNFESKLFKICFIWIFYFITVAKQDIAKLPPMDIEDLVKEGTQKKYLYEIYITNILYFFVFRFCPYFAARDLKEKADIIFMPYNYLLDAKVFYQRSKIIMQFVFLFKGSSYS
jgi:regulator of telomere elongation helicase 1